MAIGCGTARRMKQLEEKEQRQSGLQWERVDRVFEETRTDLIYRLHCADSDPDYQKASYEYGQLIKRMAENGQYNYPAPPRLPRYR